MLKKRKYYRRYSAFCFLLLSVLALIFMAGCDLYSQKYIEDFPDSITSDTSLQEGFQEKKGNNLKYNGQMGIIAKSDIVLLNSEKKKVLRELDKELDNLFNTINQSK